MKRDAIDLIEPVDAAKQHMQRMKVERPEIFPQWQRFDFARRQLERAKAEFEEARKEWERV